MASSVGLRATAVLLVIINVAFLVLVAWLVFQHGKGHATAFLRQAGAIGKAAFGLVKSCARLLSMKGQGRTYPAVTTLKLM